MLMKVKAVTQNYSRADMQQWRDEARAAGLPLDEQFAVPWRKAEARGWILHLECGHEFGVKGIVLNPAPAKFECRYCSRVATIEEMDDQREHARAFQQMR